MLTRWAFPKKKKESYMGDKIFLRKTFLTKRSKDRIGFLGSYWFPITRETQEQTTT